MSKFSIIHIPFDYRHTCWFCGEPSLKYFDSSISSDCQYTTFYLAIPACKECVDICLKSKVVDVFGAQKMVKKTLLSRYKKDLAIGLNWTEKELVESEFEGGAFEGFKKSGWLMYSIAKTRVNFIGWPLEVDGILINQTVTEAFEFDGIQYRSIDEAINHYCSAWQLNQLLLKQTLLLVGKDKFGFALRLCRPYINLSESERKIAFKEIENRIHQYD